MKKTVETLLALLLSTVLIFSALPTALAADNGTVSRAIALQMLYNHAGRPKIEAGTQSSRHRLVNHVDLATSGMLGRVAHGTNLDVG